MLPHLGAYKVRFISSVLHRSADESTIMHLSAFSHRRTIVSLALSTRIAVPLRLVISSARSCPHLRQALYLLQFAYISWVLKAL
ncbi:hypothetical protein C8R45DRAFT_1220570 [Mycena sanguinolenta]|nr:hypothetical protein C8R45DRAFT_1220570 [Mycena sanguinolenta]